MYAVIQPFSEEGSVEIEVSSGINFSVQRSRHARGGVIGVAVLVTVGVNVNVVVGVIVAVSVALSSAIADDAFAVAVKEFLVLPPR